ncbi:MAG TPA: hypothetical protein VF718_02510 [Allosphingosinicella sp.]|jgi:hypothetical protein
MDLVRIAAGIAVLLAGAPAAASAGAAGKKADSERMICKSKAVVGSRLKRVRECATAEQWEEMKLQEQVGLMRKQYNGDPSDKPLEVGGRDTPW